MFTSAIRTFAAVSATAALTIAAGLATAPKSEAADYCTSGRGYTVCATYGRYYDVVDVTTDAGNITMKVRCTEPTSTTYRWEWEVIKSYNATRSDADGLAKSYCQGRLGISA